MKVFETAIWKFNGGRGALLCNGCGVIIATGPVHVDCEYYCVECSKEIDDGEVPGQRRRAEYAEHLKELFGDE